MAEKTLTGRDYIAVVRISTKADETLAEIGERCDRVPVESLIWLDESGAIRYEPVVDTRARRRKAAEEVEECQS